MKEQHPDSRGERPGSVGGVILWSLLLFFLLPMMDMGRMEVSAQSIVGGEVEGTVLDEAGRPIRGASASLRESRSGLQWSVRTPTDGTFSFESVPGGAYEMQVEALGYRPLVVLGLGVTPGETAQVRVRLVAEPPPLTRTDTLRFSASGGAVPVLGLRSDWTALSALPDRTRDLRGFLSASSWSDGEGGLEGLPAQLTTIYADGEPFRGARHPAIPGVGGPMALLFPRIGLQSATVRTGLEDIEWSGATGGIVSLETRPPDSHASGELFGFWSGGPTWSNEVVGEGPDLLSAWGGGSVSVPVADDASSISLSFEAGLVETPNLFWRDDYFAQRVLEEDGAPGTRTTGYGSGLARTGWTFGESGTATLRAGFSAFRNETDRFGIPQTGYGSEMAGEGTDGSMSAVVTFPVSDAGRLEIRGTGNVSSRSWGDVDNPGTGAYLVGDRALLGTNPSYAASVDRVDLSITPVAHFRFGDDSRVKAGVRLEFGTFEMAQEDQGGGSYFFGSRSGLQAGQGGAIALNDAVPSEDFSVSRATIFGQYRWEAAPGLNLTTGVSYKVENLPTQDVEPNLEWIELTGLPNVGRDKGLSALGARVHLRWDLRNDGRTWLIGGMGLEHGVFDPAAMYQVLSLDGNLDVTRTLGSGLVWPEARTGGSGITGTRLALFGPDLQSPRTARGALAFYHTLQRGVRLGVSGSFRRTESLLRRTDLNRLLVPSATDQNGRPIFGDLKVVSGVLAAEPGTNRRFPGFESVWALNSDGWSEYVGLTASVDLPLWAEGFLTLRYTWSETTDNWVGASQSGALSRLPAEVPVEDWDEAKSDFDVPHRFNALAMVPLPLPWGGELTGLYSLRSDFPFTPRVATGLDANGDGSPFNDVAFIPASGQGIEALAQEWDCLGGSLGAFPERNACRGDMIHTLDLRLSLGLPSVAGVSSRLVVDGLNLTDRDMGIRDDNLLLLRSGTVREVNGTVEVPYKVNSGFGDWVYRGDTGRMIRVGVKIGGGR